MKKKNKALHILLDVLIFGTIFSGVSYVTSGLVNGFEETNNSIKDIFNKNSNDSINSFSKIRKIEVGEDLCNKYILVNLSALKEYANKNYPDISSGKVDLNLASFSTKCIENFPVDGQVKNYSGSITGNFSSTHNNIYIELVSGIYTGYSEVINVEDTDFYIFKIDSYEKQIQPVPSESKYYITSFRVIDVLDSSFYDFFQIIELDDKFDLESDESISSSESTSSI